MPNQHLEYERGDATPGGSVYGRRVVAAAIDTVLFFVILLAVWALTQTAGRRWPDTWLARVHGVHVVPAMLVVTDLLDLLLLSPGKRLLGLRRLYTRPRRPWPLYVLAKHPFTAFALVLCLESVFGVVPVSEGLFVLSLLGLYYFAVVVHLLSTGRLLWEAAVGMSWERRRTG